MAAAFRTLFACAFLSSTAAGVHTILVGTRELKRGRIGSALAAVDTPLANITVEAEATDPLRQGWKVDGDAIVISVLAVVLFVVIMLILFVAAKVEDGNSQGGCMFNDAEVQKMFRSIDKDHSGTLSKEEVRLYMKEQGHVVPDNQLMALMELADEDNSGDLDPNEFRILLTNIRDENPQDLVRGLVAELVGMLIWQFLGGMPDTGALGNWLLLVGLIYCFAPISGAHFNPAITLAVYMSGQIPLKKALYYVTVNILGAIDAVLWLRWLGIEQIESDSGLPIVPCTTPPLIIPISVLFLLEAVCTFTFVIVVLGVAIDSKSAWGNIAPIVIGIAGYGASSACGKISGVSMNPGRFLGPSIGYGCFPGPGRSIAYLCSAMVGSFAACLLYTRVFMNRPAPDLAGGMSNFQFMLRDCSDAKKAVASHRRSTIAEAPA